MLRLIKTLQMMYILAVSENGTLLPLGNRPTARTTTWDTILPKELIMATFLYTLYGWHLLPYISSFNVLLWICQYRRHYDTVFVASNQYTCSARIYDDQCERCKTSSK